MSQADSFSPNVLDIQHLMPSIENAFHFTQEDLMANRAGTITLKQRDQVKATGNKYMTQMILVIGLVFVIAAVRIMLTPAGDAIRQLYDTNPAAVLAGAAAFVLFYVILLIYSVIRVRNMSGNVKVGTVMGIYKPIGRTIRALDGTIYQRIKIGRRQLMINAEQADQLTKGTTYRAYTTGRGQMAQILSIETA